MTIGVPAWATVDDMAGKAFTPKADTPILAILEEGGLALSHTCLGATFLSPMTGSASGLPSVVFLQSLTPLPSGNEIETILFCQVYGC